MFVLMMGYSFSYGPGRGDYPAVAPNADFETRRAWGKKEMFEYFELAEKWVKKSTLIAEDVGAVTGVAPIGSPNRFYAGGFTDGSYCTMNLQVIGLKGEGVLTMPEVNVNNMLDLYDISEDSTWSFGGETELILHSGKSWLQESNVGSLFEQIRADSDQNQHEQVVEICELLNQATGDGFFRELPVSYRAELFRRYSKSLRELGLEEEAVEVLHAEATAHMERVYGFRHGNASDKDPKASLEAARVAIMEAINLKPDDNRKLVGLAKERALFAYNLQNGKYDHFTMDEDEKRDRIKRTLGDLYDCVVSEAKRSSWLKSQMGSMSFEPIPQNCNNVQIDKHGMYRANVVVEVTGNWGRKGKLEIRLWESEDGNQPVDLNAEIPRRPRYPFTYRIAHWEDSNGKKTKLVTKKQSAVLEPVKKKK